LFSVFSISGCIDIFQHITKDNGIDKHTIKVTVSKVVFAMAKGDNDIDYGEIFDGSNIDIEEYNQYNASVKTINDAMDVAFLFDMDIDYRDRTMVNRINRDNPSFIPKYNGKNMSIHIDSLSNNSDSTEDNAIAAAFLATGKYRLAISKNVLQILAI
jgi:Fe-S cluster assembly iron-binding protein IscA